jgi:hypothetical protein
MKSHVTAVLVLAMAGALASLASPDKNLIPRLGILCIELDKDVARSSPHLWHYDRPQGPTQA